jgi:hypothetical protein
MSKIKLVAWSEEEAAEHVRELESAGFTVDPRSLRGAGGIIGRFREAMPDAVVIDLDRMPSFGRVVATMLRDSRTTRHLPLVFAGGAAEKVARIKSDLPDAVFTPWAKVAAAIRKAIAHPPPAPIKPTPHMERWDASSLVKKLSIQEGMQIAVLGDFDEMAEIVGELPQNAAFVKRFTAETRLALYVVKSAGEAARAFEHAVARLPTAGSLWIIHPKQSKQRGLDFNQNDVRALGIAHGFVDYKVCSVNSDWSGLKFARRRK